MLLTYSLISYWLVGITVGILVTNKVGFDNVSWLITAVLTLIGAVLFLLGARMLLGTLNKVK